MAANEAKVTFKGQPVTLSGPQVQVGQKAPEFTAVKTDLGEFQLSDVKGKVVVLSAVPSLDTPVCDAETRRFNHEAASMGDDVQIVTISMDLPFAQKRWCAGAGIDRVTAVSDHRDASFITAYGLLLPDLRLLTRAVIVLDKEGTVRYVQVVPEIASEPDYEPVLAAVKELK